MHPIPIANITVKKIISVYWFICLWFVRYIPRIQHSSLHCVLSYHVFHKVNSIIFFRVTHFHWGNYPNASLMDMGNEITQIHKKWKHNHCKIVKTCTYYMFYTAFHFDSLWQDHKAYNSIHSQLPILNETPPRVPPGMCLGGFNTGQKYWLICINIFISHWNMMWRYLEKHHVHCFIPCSDRNGRNGDLKSYQFYVCCIMTSSV